MLGVDKGTTYTKTDKGLILRSTVRSYRKNEVLLNDDKTIVEYEGEKYIVGEKGNYSTDLMKSQHENTKLLILTAVGLSVDMALFERQKLIKYSTYSMGIMKLYSRIANYINSEYDLSLTEWEIEDVIANGLYIYGEKVELNLDSLIKEHTEEIIERLKLEYDLKVIRNILLVGGGSQFLCKHIQKYIPQSVLMQNSQFSNAIGYRNIGKVIFK